MITSPYMETDGNLEKFSGIQKRTNVEDKRTLEIEHRNPSTQLRSAASVTTCSVRGRAIYTIRVMFLKSFV